MSHVQENSNRYVPSELSRGRSQLQYELFIGRVLSVDQERICLTVEDIRDNTVYSEVRIFPAEHSSVEATSITMPEQFSTCVACNIQYQQGFSQIAILSWVTGSVAKALDAIAFRPVSGTVIQGLSDRLRGTYRKAYPGQKTSSYTGGYTDKIDSGWDRAGSDLSRDRLDPERRQWTQVTGRRLAYSDAGVSLHGVVNRPDAETLTPVQLPDGTFEYVSYLAPGSKPTDRYVDGKPDVIPFAENTELTQEFALDYPIPAELLQTDLLDKILGTTQQPWDRTSVGALPVSGTTGGTAGVQADNQTYLISQKWDHPFDTTQTPLGPTLNEGPTPQRRAFIVEKSSGTLVGYNRFDKVTYGHVLKPTLFPNTSQGRFGADIDSTYVAVKDSSNHDEARLAASCYSIRFPYEYNTTRLDVTKEGFTSMEIGSTLPMENNQFGGGYEHPHGAGRSLEAHFVGSVKAVVGKNRDEEEAIDLQALGQVVVRLGADDQGLPNARRRVQTQIRSKADAPADRLLQYWDSRHLGLKTAGDSGVNTAGYNKTGAESISLQAAFDGAAVIRLGARNPAALRRHLVNGYKDGPGVQAYGVGDSDRIDSHTVGRPNYGGGDSKYSFTHSSGHSLITAGQPTLNMLPYNLAAYQSLGTPLPADPNVKNNGVATSAMDQHGLSLDLHSVQDMLVRVGKNLTSGQSVIIDSDGGLVATIGKDNKGRSVTASFDGGVQITIAANNKGKALQIELLGDIDIVQQGHLQVLTTGDWITECNSWRHISKTDTVFTQQKSIWASLTRHTIEAPDIVHNQGTQVPAPGDENS